MATEADYAAEADAFSKQYTAEQEAKAAQDKQQGEPGFYQKWVAPVGKATLSTIDSAVSSAENWISEDNAGPVAQTMERGARNVAAGAIKGAENTADAVHSLYQTVTGGPRPSPLWDHAKAAITDFRDAVAVKDPTLSDSLIQGVSQLAVPFAGWSRALAGVHGFMNAIAAGAVTDATALAPHDMRTADLLALAKHTEGKFGEVLNKLAPDGSALNAYINYLTDRTNESEAAGRFKNVLDGFGVNLVATPLLHAVGVTLKQGLSGLRYMAENGIRNTLSDMAQMAPVGAAGQRGSVGVTNNASGESAASQEAVNRVAQEKADGITRHLVDMEGNATPLTGVDAVDRRAPAGHIIVREFPDGRYDVLDRGGTPDAHIKGVIARWKARSLTPQELHDINPSGMKSQVMAAENARAAGAAEKK